MSRSSKILFVCFSVCIVLLVLKIYLDIKRPVDKNILDDIEITSFVVKDRNGIELSKLYPSFGGNFEKAEYKELPKNLIYALIAGEDKRFFKHKGVDLIAIFRAIKDNLFKRKIISGGSTITQQLVRMLFKYKRSYKNKIFEMFTAFRYDHQFTKEEILSAYLNRVFMGNQIYGVKAGASLYLGKELSDISLSESAFLIGLLKSGVKYNPYKNFKKADNRRKYILQRMLKEKYINKNEYELALSEGIKLQKFLCPFKAPHFCFYIKKKLRLKGNNNVKEVITTLSYPMQKKIRSVLRNNVKRLKGLNVNNASVVILNAKTGELLSMIGSMDYFNYDQAGQVNGAVSLRQPGSCLKPILYAYIFTKGHSPADIIGDIKTAIPTVSGDYCPVNYDRKYHGPVSIREALACSYNIPAVRWLFKYDYKEYIDLLRRLGFVYINKPYNHYGLAVALGTAEIKLIDLVHAYTVFANKGYLLPVKDIKSIKLLSGRRLKMKYKNSKKVLNPDSVYLINNILTDRNARMKAFPSMRSILYPFDIAFKTGTSKDYKDAWVIGYTKDYIVGIWLGNFKGESMNKITGGNGAVPLLYDIFLEINPELKEKRFNKPSSIVYRNVCPLSGKLPTENCPVTVEEVFVKDGKKLSRCDMHKLYYKKDDDSIKKKVFKILPSEYSKWCMENNWETPEKGWKRYYKNKIRIKSEKYVKVLYPDNGDIFRVDPILPVEYQRIELRADIPEDTLYLEWYFNDKLWKKIDKGDSCSWKLKRGDHLIYIKAYLHSGEIFKSDNVNIKVQ